MMTLETILKDFASLLNKKRGIFFFSIAINSLFFTSAKDWVLSSCEFSLSSAEAGSVEKQVASLLPSLILEHIITDTDRFIPREEALDRALDASKTERLSLFLQLSKEVKTRDSVFLIESSSRAKKKKISASEKKIKELKDEIEENIKAEETLINSYSTADYSEGMENIVLYKNSPSSLFKASDDKLSVDSREFAKEIEREGINALIRGSVIAFSGYISVTVDLYTFPLARKIATVTDVSSISDLTLISRRIAFSLMPHINNSSEVKLIFDITPQEAMDNLHIMVDSFITEPVDNALNLPSGLHTLQISSEGYITQTVSYNFCDSKVFYVRANLKENASGTFTLHIKNPIEGSGIYASGSLLKEANDNSIEINGKNVLGQVVLKGDEDGSFLTGFFYIPQEKQTEDAIVSINPKVQDRASLIDERRIWMYRGYTALMLSLPFTFYSIGTFNSLYYGYRTGGVELSDVYKWNTLRYVSAGISVAAGGFFVFELVRYLIAANSVLPVSPYSVTKSDER